MNLRAYTEQVDQNVEQYRTELARKDKKIQSQRYIFLKSYPYKLMAFYFSSQILRLTQHNKRSTERLNELQRCLEQIKGTITGQNAFDQLRDILRLVLFKINFLLPPMNYLYFIGILLCQKVKQQQIYRIKIVQEKNLIRIIYTIYQKLLVNQPASEELNDMYILLIKSILNVLNMMK